MSCFCDIPLSRISEHTEFYGKYGIGLTKSWGKKNGLNPVIYSTPHGHTQNSMRFFMEHDFDDEIFSEAQKHIHKLLALHKPIAGNMIIRNEVIPKEFHLENEWRYIPDCNIELIFDDTPKKETDKSNKKLEEFKLQISPSDIKYIFVPEDEDIPSLADFINNELGQFPHNDIKILQTRIVSLNTLKKDM